MRAIGRFLGGLFILLLLVAGGIRGCMALVDHGIIHVDTSPPAQPKKTAGELQRELRWNRILAAGASLRRSARDPTSVVFEDVRASDDGAVLCFTFRARNGFGGMTREVLVMANGKASQERAVWKKHCDSEANDENAAYALNRWK